MKLIQLNIWQGRLILNALRFFEKAQPDILCLQEVCNSPQGRSGYFDNLQDIQKSFDYPYMIFAPTIDWMHSGLNIEGGNAILSRYPLEDIATVFTHGERKHNISFDAFEERNFNFHHAVLNNDGKKTHLVNHHGWWFDGPKSGNTESTRKLNIVADYIQKLEGPVILTGDLNVSQDSPSLSRLNAEMENLCLTHNVKTTRNFVSYNPIDVCDFIFTRDIDTESFIVHDEVVSDHSMLELNFR